MKKSIKLLLTSLFAVLTLSCSLNFNDVQLSIPDTSSSSVFSERNYVYSTNSFDGSVTSSSDEKGIHIDVMLEEDNKYNQITLYVLEKGNEITVETIKPLYENFYYMEVDGKIVPNGGSIIKGNESTGTETDVASSYRTNYLSEGTHTFDLPFVEAGKTYTFFVCISESAGYYYDVTTQSSGTIRTIDFEKADSFYISTLNHFTELIKVTANNDYKAPAINASYNKETDEYKFSKTDFSSYGNQFSSLTQDEISFNIDLTYKDLDSESQTYFSLDYNNSDEEKIYNLSEIIENLDETEYEKPFTLLQTSLELNYQDHFDKKYEDCTTNEQLLDYYNSFYAITSYKFSNTYTNLSLPDNLTIPDKRMQLEVTATENGNVISFNMADDASEISFYDKSNDYKLGTMYGELTAGTDYSFTDYLAENGKAITYYAKWNKRHSAYGSATTLENTKYYPKTGTSTFDEETMIYTVTENPFKDCEPENFKGIMKLYYGTKDNSFLDLDDSFTDLDLSDFSKQKEFSGQTFQIISFVRVCYSGNVNDIYYENNAKINNTFNFIESITFKDNYVEPENNNNDDNYDYDNGDISEVEPLKTTITVEDDLNMTSKEKKEYIDNFYKTNSSSNVAVLDNKDLPKITQILETDDGIELTIYIPEWLNNLKVIRYDHNKVYDETNNSYYYIGRISATYVFDVKNFTTGTVTLKDYYYVKNQEYNYELTFLAYGNADSRNNDNLGKTIRTYYAESLSNYANVIYITPENESTYYVQKCPVVTVSDGTLSLENTSLGWNKLPEGYKDLNSYKNSFYYYYINTSGIELQGANNSSLSIDNFRKIPIQKDEAITYYCHEVAPEALYFEDEYGNKVEVSFTDKQITKYFTNTSNYWSMRYDGYSLVKGKYKTTECKTGMYNDYGMWTYDPVVLAEGTANSTFEVQ